MDGAGGDVRRAERRSTSRGRPERKAFSETDAAELERRTIRAMREADLTCAGELAAQYDSLVEGSDIPNHRWLTSSLSRDKTLHDLRQLEYLSKLRPMSALSKTIDAHRVLLSKFEKLNHGDRLEWTSPAGTALAKLREPGNRIIRPRRRRSVFSKRWDRTATEKVFLAERPRIVIIDDFLDAKTLAALRAFCLAGRFWHGNRYDDGRLSALFLHGFNSPLLLQIAEELKLALPNIIPSSCPLRQMWAFKNTKPLAANTTMHADFAAVNVNFWITPDSANCDPESGGMIIHHLSAPPNWGFHEYNRDSALIAQYVDSCNPLTTVIPYRANRAIIFDSDLFHETSAVKFNDAYENYRTNVTMLFGDRVNNVSPDVVNRVANWRSQAFQRLRYV